MKTTRYLSLVLIGVVAAAVYGQSASKAKKMIKSSPATTSQSSPSAKEAAPFSGAVSANPPSKEMQAQMNAAYAQSDAFYKQATALSQAGDLKGAEAACIDALNSPPIIRGQPQHVPFVAHLLGQIYLKDGQYQKAVYWLQGAHPNTAGGSLNLDLALAYLRLGDYAHARECYSDQATLRYCSDQTSEDLPGTASPQALEASILLARGVDAFLEERNDDALPDLQRANQLAPSNPVIAYQYAQVLSRKKQYSEAMPLYRLTALKGHGRISDDADRRVGGARAAATQPKQ